MGQPKKIITIVGERQAKPGFSFIYSGPSTTCEGCNYLKVCLEKLEESHAYKVVEIRDRGIPCKVHADKARVVEVIEADTPFAVDRKGAFEGATVTFKKIECNNQKCLNTGICMPIGLKDGEKYKIVEVLESISCPLQRPLVVVRAQRAPKAS